MKFIHKTKQGKSFRVLLKHHLNNDSYDDIGDDHSKTPKVTTRTDLLNDLLDQQGYLCAFCMQKISIKSATIEHIIGQKFNLKTPAGEDQKYDYDAISTKYKKDIQTLLKKVKKGDQNIGKNHDTNFYNMVAVCKGDKNKYCKKGLTCDKSRANLQSKRPYLFLNPLNESQMQNIYFSRKGRIYYKEFISLENLNKIDKFDDYMNHDDETNIRYDLEYTLNLNCPTLVNHRRKLIEALEHTLFYKNASPTQIKKNAEKCLNILLSIKPFDEFFQVKFNLLNKYL